MKPLKKALISGVTGQDGSYLSDLLLHLGYEVHGIVRPSSTFNRSRIEHILSNKDFSNRYFLHYGDVSDSVSVNSLLLDIKPDEFYNLAAQSHVGISFQMPEYSTFVNGNAVTNILETIRSQKLDTKFYQACTSEMFGSTPPPQSEASIFMPQSPYAAAKLFAYHSCQNYRDAHGLHVSCGILFNHESYRRGLNFVTKKIVTNLVRIHYNEIQSFKLGNLQSTRDWGWAPEYVLAMWSMVQLEKSINLVVGTGISASVYDFVKLGCSTLNLDIENVLKVDPTYLRPLEVDALRAETSLMRKSLGWTPALDWKKLMSIMIEDELKKRERVIDWDNLMDKK
jgi:GDPmannose 4,6-dehydratase